MRPVSRRSRPSWPRSASCGSRQARTTCALDANDRKKIARNWRLLDDGTRLLLRDVLPRLDLGTEATHAIAWGTAGRLRLDGLSRTRGQWSSVRPVTGCGAVIKVSSMTGGQRKALGSVSRLSSERGGLLLFLAALASTPFHLLLDQRVKNLARHRF